MKTLNKIFLGIYAISSFVIVNNVFAADAKTKVVIPDHSIITGIRATAKVTLSGSDIENSIANNVPLETTVIANACIFTTHQDGDYDMTITADKSYVKGNDFALYNASLGQVVTTLYVSSVEDAKHVALKPGKAQGLKDHSDNNASGSNCTNQVKFHLSISVADLRIAKAGTYDFGFSALTTPYSG